VTAIDAPEHDQDFDDSAPGEQRTFRPRWATALALLCVLTLIGGGLLAYWLLDQPDYSAEAEDRAEVVEAAEVFVETWNTFRPKDAAAYLERVSPLLTTKFGQEFENASEDVVTGIVQQRLFSKGNVLTDADEIPLIGISTIDGDSAEVLVVSDATRVANRQRVLRHWRWQVSMRKVDGQWLVDSFKEV
jgi:hypothetical protein